VAKGAEITNELSNNFVIFEGSGASVPPIKTDGWLLAIGAYQPVETIINYMGAYRIRKSDLIVLTMCEEHTLSIVKSKEIVNFIRRVNPEADIANIIFRPRPQKSIKGKKVLYATTASESVGEILKEYLEKTFDCEVVGMTHRLSNRKELVHEIQDIEKKNPNIDVLLTELKAAAIDVAANVFHDKMEIVFCDNEPLQIDGDFDLKRMILDLADIAIERFRENV
jgi:cyclic 2,3-diphosphoglycerate synthetase